MSGHFCLGENVLPDGPILSSQLSKKSLPLIFSILARLHTVTGLDRTRPILLPLPIHILGDAEMAEIAAELASPHNHLATCHYNFKVIFHQI